MGHNRSLGMGNASMMARMALRVVCRLCSSVRSSLGWDVKGISMRARNLTALGGCSNDTPIVKHTTVFSTLSQAVWIP